MPLTAADRAELDDLLDQVAECDLNEAGRVQLNALLLQEPAARELYCDYLRLHGMLASDAVEGPAFVADKQSATDRALSSLGQISASVPPDATKQPRIPGRLGYISKNRPLVWSMLAASVLFTAYFMAITWNMWGREKPDHREMATHESETWAHGAVATFRERSNVRWASATPPAARLGDFAFGDALVIESGVVELQLKQGTVLFIKAPAQWSIDGENLATLKRGRLVAKVPPQATGFMLNTPAAKITDLGTEFGVEVTKSGSHVQVLKGLVDVESTKKSGSPGSRRLTAGQGVRVTAKGGITPLKDSNAVEQFTLLRDGHDEQAAFSEFAPIDLKRRAKVSQSSVYSRTWHPPKLAIDGRPATFIHTEVNDVTPWWQAELEQPALIAAVMLKNRVNRCGGRSRDLSVVVLAEDGKTELWRSPLLNPDNRLSAGINDFNRGPDEIAVDINRLGGTPIRGKFVRVERKVSTTTSYLDDKNCLNLSEIQIFEAIDKQPTRDKSP